MHAVTSTLDASRVRRCLAILALVGGLTFPLVVAPAADAARSRLSRALLGGTNEPGVKQPRPDGLGSLGTEVITAADKVLNAGSSSRRSGSR